MIRKNQLPYLNESIHSYQPSGINDGAYIWVVTKKRK